MVVVAMLWCLAYCLLFVGYCSGLVYFIDCVVFVDLFNISYLCWLDCFDLRCCGECYCCL